MQPVQPSNNRGLVPYYIARPESQGGPPHLETLFHPFTKADIVDEDHQVLLINPDTGYKEMVSMDEALMWAEEVDAREAAEEKAARAATEKRKPKNKKNKKNTRG